LSFVSCASVSCVRASPGETHLTQNKTVSKLIPWLKPELILSGKRRSTAYLRNNRFIWTKLCQLNYLYRHRTAHNTFYRDLFAHTQFAFAMVKRSPGTYARTCR